MTRLRHDEDGKSNSLVILAFAGCCESHTPERLLLDDVTHGCWNAALEDFK